MVNERGSNGKITAIFQTQTLPFQNSITAYSRIVLLNRYRSAWIAQAWLLLLLPSLIFANKPVE